ncbi:MAG: ABC transporter permease [Methanobacteriota archaeon]
MIKHSLSLSEKLEVVYISMWRYGKLMTRFKTSFFFSIVAMFVSITTFYYFGQVFGDATAVAVEDYGGNYFSYVLIGLAFNQFAVTSLSTYLATVQNIYWSNWLELILTAPMRLKTYFVAAMSWAYTYSTILIAFYFIIGVGIFGAAIAFPPGWYVIILILFLTVLSISGIGLMAASTFMLLNAKGQVEPISWFVGTVSALVCGVYYPPELLPPSIHAISYIFPHTYALEGLREILLNGKGLMDPSIQMIILILAIFSMILLPLGMAMFKSGIKKAEKDGTLARWV